MIKALPASFRYEILVSGLMAAFAGLFLLAVSDLDTRYTLAIVAAIGGVNFPATLPERRVLCLMLWVLIHPLGVEKIFLIDAAEGPQFTDPSMIFNASDGPLALLAVFVVAETIISGRVVFQWSRMTTVFLVLLVWSGISFAIHAIFLDDQFTTSAPYALIQDVRLLVLSFSCSPRFAVAATSCWSCLRSEPVSCCKRYLSGSHTPQGMRFRTQVRMRRGERFTRV